MTLSLSNLADFMEGLIPTAEELCEMAEEVADLRIETAKAEQGACMGNDTTTGQPCCLWARHHEAGWPEHLDATRWWQGERP